MFNFFKNLYNKAVALVKQIVTVIVEKLAEYKEAPEQAEEDLAKVKSLVSRVKDFALIVIQILVLISASKAEVHTSYNNWKNS